MAITGFVLIASMSLAVAADVGKLDCRRKEQIALGRATDHAADVMLAKIPNFDMDKSIFAEVTGTFARTAMLNKLEWRPFWLDNAVDRITEEHAMVEPAPPIKESLMDFINNKCNFKVEHADGSFFDHLKFSYEYTVRNYPGVSAIPPFLHSIMGVGTNYFPMDKSLIPELQSLITNEEFVHVESFPSFLRFVIQRTLIRDLAALDRNKLKQIKAIRLYRVIDNKPLELNATQMWVQLNYQMLHALDFLPVSSWDYHAWDPFLGEFDELYAMMVKADQLQVKLKPSMTSNFTDYPPHQPPITLFMRAVMVGPASLQSSIAAKHAATQVEEFSVKIGHNLSYEFVFAQPDVPRNTFVI